MASMPRIPAWLIIAQWIVLLFPVVLLTHAIWEAETLAVPPDLTEHGGQILMQNSQATPVILSKATHGHSLLQVGRVSKMRLPATSWDFKHSYHGSAAEEVPNEVKGISLYGPWPPPCNKSLPVQTVLAKPMQMLSVPEVDLEPRAVALEPMAVTAAESLMDSSTEGSDLYSNFWGIELCRRRTATVGAAVVGFGLLQVQTGLRSAVLLSI